MAVANDAGDEFDYIVVGGGSAGCVLANRLSADPKNRVLLIEAGGNNKHFWVDVPLGVPFLHRNPRFDWNYASEPEPHLDGRVIRMPRGRGLGGSSAINGMMYVRGLASDYDRWRQFGNTGWAWDDVLPYFKKSQKHIAPSNDSHGTEGELDVSLPRHRWQILESYIEAAAEAGIPHAPNYNAGGEEEGVAYSELTVKEGVRWSTARAFIEPVKKRANLVIATDALAEGIDFEGKRARAVRYRKGGVTHTARARGEIVVSSGAFGSPHLLQLSGVGPAALLRQNGIDVVHELPGVGENLHDHWMVRVIHALSNARTLHDYIKGPIQKAVMGAHYLLTRKGPMGEPPNVMVTFMKSDPAVVAPDIQVTTSVIGLANAGDPAVPYPSVTSSVCIRRPTSRGHLRLKSPDPAARPAVLNNYMATEEDRAIAISGIRRTRKIFEQPSFAKYAPKEDEPSASAKTDEAILAVARQMAITVFHPVGTCKMGPDKAAVVDDRLRVHGIGGLRVADASIMPTITSGNTNAPTIMIAEKASEMILADNRAK